MREITNPSLTDRLYLIQRICLIFVLLALPPCRAYAAQVLAELPANQQEIIERVCLPLQYKQGSEAYRECLRAELAARRTAAPMAITSLALDEQYAVQRACRQAGDILSTAHQICAEKQIELLRTEPEPQFAAISIDEQHAIQQACFDVQSAQAAQTYRRCVNEALSTVKELPETDLTTLTLAERTSLQQTCMGSTNDPRDYRQCLLAAGIVNDNGLTTSQNPAQVAGSTTTGQSGSISKDSLPPGAQPTEAGQNGAVDESVSSTLAEAAEAISEAAASLSAGDSRVTPADGKSGVIERDTLVPLPDQSAPAARQIQRQPPNEALASVSGASSAQKTDSAVSAQTNTTDGSIGSASEENFQLADLLKNLQATLNGLSGVNRMLTVAALALPLILIMSWLIFRRRDTHRPQGPSSSDRRYQDAHSDIGFIDNAEDLDATQRLKEQASNLFDDLPHAAQRKSESAVDQFAETEYSTTEKKDIPSSSTSTNRVTEDQPTTIIDFPAGDAIATQDMEEQLTEKMDFLTDNATATQDSKVQLTEKMDLSIGNATANPDAEEKFDELFETAVDDTINESMEFAPGGGGSGEFGVWIEQQCESRRLSFAIEFLIYWLAYADKRYEPSLKAMVFKMKDPDEQTQIKRWVLQNDIYSFADAVRWLQSHATLQQRTQIIDLLIALLVSENALTPIQNTLFRFLGDAFGLGQVDLNSRFRQAFDQPLAQLPRVDKPNWWKTHTEEQRIRWNARIVAKQPQEIQHRVKLGLPLSGELQSALILACFQRAEARCHPQQFQDLGERELHMVERQLVKFEAARDALLELVI